VDIITESQKQKPLKIGKILTGFDQFAQALKETNAPKAYVTN
jgi:hypothetical protein